MLATEIFVTSHGRDFLVRLGGGSAALTGLVFVALTLNLSIVTGDPTHRHRASGTLTGFTAVLVMAAFSMMGVQNHFSIAVEWRSISLLAAVTYVYGYVRAIVASGSDIGLGNLRLVSGTSLYIAEVLGSVLVGFGYVVGLHLTAAAMLFLLAFTISRVATHCGHNGEVITATCVPDAVSTASQRT